ncbi:MAG: putative metal-binding protein [Rhodobacteraceae bacterium HLUCCO07]|nr:MAG: putative metal-binding protein [Rhodobacteraceae bacterium HLUCCO07]
MPRYGNAARFRLADLSHKTPTGFDLRPDAETLKAMARDLGLDDLRKLSFTGSIRAEGARDWRLDARLGATVVQPCVVTLAPVTTRIEEDVTRRYLAHMPEDGVTDDEVEMPQDESIEPLGEVIDVGAAMVEALVLALPLYPRADDATLEQAQFSEPGKAPMRDEDARPFAALKALRDKLERDD